MINISFALILQISWPIIFYVYNLNTFHGDFVNIILVCLPFMYGVVIFIYIIIFTLFTMCYLKCNSDPNVKQNIRSKYLELSTSDDNKNSTSDDNKNSTCHSTQMYSFRSDNDVYNTSVGLNNVCKNVQYCTICSGTGNNTYNLGRCILCHGTGVKNGI